MTHETVSSEKEKLSAREKRIKEAVVMHYGKGKQVQEIAEEMDYDRKTIQRYLDSDFASNLQRVYSDKEIYDLKAQLENEIRDSYKMANNLLARAIKHEDTTPRDLIKASKEAQEISMRHIKMLKELGIKIQKEQKNKHSQKESNNLEKRLIEAYKEVKH